MMATEITLPEWWQHIDARERAQIDHALEYADRFKEAGVPGHGQFILIAKLVRQIQELDATKNKDAQRVAWDDTIRGWRDIVTGVRVAL